MSQQQLERYTFSRLLSYHRGIFHFADTTRNVGKTWALQRLIWRRAYKHDRKAIIVRRTKKQAIKAADDLYSSPKLLEICKGILPFNPDTKKGNFKRRGRKFFIKRNGRWEWFLQIVANSECQDCRGFMDERCDRIFFDEYLTTSRRRKHYQGNEVEDMIDLLISISRQHRIKVVFCGNKEDTENPYYNYFNIPPLPVNYEGIRAFRKGTLIVEQFNRVIYDDKQWQQDLNDLLKGTPYGDFMFNSQYKNGHNIVYRETPRDVTGYAQFYWDNKPLRVTTKGDLYYVDLQADITTLVATDRIYSDIRYQRQLNRKQDRNKFRGWQAAYITNKIVYKNAQAYDITKKIMKWFGIINA